MANIDHLLGSGVKDLLESLELHARRTKHHANLMDVRDEDGVTQFRVPINIDLFSLASILDHGNRQREIGRRVGVQELQCQFRALMALAEAPGTAAGS